LIKEARGFGSTIDEAKENAILNLNASEDDDIQFEIIAMPKKKTLGLFGGSKAEVRVYVELPDPKPPKAKKKPVQKPKKQEAVKEAAPKTEAAPQKSEKDSSKDFGELVSENEIAADSPTARAIAYLRPILKSLGCGNVEFKAAVKENAALIELICDDFGTIIGHRGETLDALQYLASLAANNGGGYFKVSLNIGDYRKKREETLINLAKRISAQVVKTGKCRTLEPMNPYERRIIHTAVQAIEGVTSASFGEGIERRVVIGLEGKELRPMRNNNSRRRDNNRPRKPRPQNTTANTPAREPKKDSDIPLYGKIN
jgi:spoIIIJ-associated protein